MATITMGIVKFKAPELPLPTGKTISPPIAPTIKNVLQASGKIWKQNVPIKTGAEDEQEALHSEKMEADGNEAAQRQKAEADGSDAAPSEKRKTDVGEAAQSETRVADSVKAT